MDWIDTEHKARKPHRCSLCGGTIDVGTKYIRQFHPQYKYASTYYYCRYNDAMSLSGNSGWYFLDIINIYTFADGTPFGMKEEE